MGIHILVIASVVQLASGAARGNPYLRVLRSQLEQLGSEYLSSKKAKTELRVITREISVLRDKLAELETRKAKLEREIKT